MDYTCNVFVHESNYKATTERQSLAEKLGLGGVVEASKPLLAVIIEKLCGGGVLGATGAQSAKPLQAAADKITKEKEGIAASLNEIKQLNEKKEKTEAAPAPTLGDAGSAAFGVDSKKDIPKMQHAEKEADEDDRQDLNKKKSGASLKSAKDNEALLEEQKNKFEGARGALKQNPMDDADGKIFLT